MEDNVELVFPVAKTILDLLIVIATYLGIWLLDYYGIITKIGFFCTDESIRYPYISSDINWNYVFPGEMMLVVIVILVGEFILYRKTDKKCRIGKLKLPLCVGKIYSTEIAFLFGLTAARLTSVIWKYRAGEFRPNFYDACKPNVDCTDPKNLMIYHTNFTCTSPIYSENAAFESTQMRSSFPCGQATFSIFCMLYLIIYLENKMTWNGSQLLRRAIQVAAFNISMYIGFLNITLYYHSALDVVVGLVLGAGSAILTAVYIGRLHIRDTPIFKSEYQEIP